VKNRSLYLILFTILNILPFGCEAQFNPDASELWRIVETDHFRVTYPDPYKDWTHEIASKMDSIHEEVTALVGYGSDREKLDILVMDPYSVSNGYALTLLKHPHIVLWPTSPLTGTMLSGRNDWGEILLTHEYTHIVHLTRQPRNWKDILISKFLPLGPVARKSPGWISEGYAVILESRLTGEGRSQSTFRASLLRQWAREGKLPPYHQLGGDNSWAGGAYPYLVGSAFMEWLRDRSGNPDCLLHLWKRMSALKSRSFEDAFKGVFQDSPCDLYGRFCAEITAAALSVESGISDQGSVTGKLWQENSGWTGSPDISPDGKKLALLLRPFRKPVKIVVYSTHELEEKEKTDGVEDPEDIPDKPWKPDKKKILSQLTERNGIRPGAPRWTADSKSLIFHSFAPLPNGEKAPDLFRWTPETGNIKRLTHGANLRNADPLPGGDSAVAVHQKSGKNSIVIHNWKTGSREYLTEPDVTARWGSPRVSPDGKTLAVIMEMKAVNTLVLIDIETKSQHKFPAEPGECFTDPNWSCDNRSLLLAVDRNGIYNIEKLDAANGSRTILTHVTGGALLPEPDGVKPPGLYYLSLNSKGFDIYHLAEYRGVDVDGSRIEGDFPVMPADVYEDPGEFAREKVAQEKKYGIGRQEFRVLMSGNWAPAGETLEIGLRGGDMIGRFQYLLLAGTGTSGGGSGGLMTFKYQGFPIRLSITGFNNRIRISEQPAAGELASALDRDVTGGLIQTEWGYVGAGWNLAVGVAGCLSEVELEPYDYPEDESASDMARSRFGLARYDSGISRNYFQARGRISYQWNYGHFRVISGIWGIQSAGRTEGDDWNQYRVRGKLQIAHEKIYLSGEYIQGNTSGDPSALDIFSVGGIQTSLEPDAANQVLLPYLPQASIWGKNLRYTRAEIGILASFPLILFADRVEAWCCEESRESFHAAGVLVRTSFPAVPLIRFPATHLSLGTAYGFDSPIEEKWRGWITLRYLL